VRGLPVYVIDGRGDLVTWNAPTREWYADFARFAGRDRNFLWWLFTAAEARVRIADWSAYARDAVAGVRFAVGTGRLDPAARHFPTPASARGATHGGLPGVVAARSPAHCVNSPRQLRAVHGVRAASAVRAEPRRAADALDALRRSTRTSLGRRERARHGGALGHHAHRRSDS